MEWSHNALGASLAVVGLVSGFVASEANAAEEKATEQADFSRSAAGLQAFYDFSSTEGDVVRDRSGNGEPLDLIIEDPRAVRRGDGQLEVREPTLIRARGRGTKIVQAVRRSGALSIEAWVRPAKEDQSGPARIVTLSKNASERNFTLGQDGKVADVRLRSTETSGNGIPSLGSKEARLPVDKVSHVVYTRSRSGRARLYIDGNKVAEARIAGSLSNWDDAFPLGLANEHSRDRAWLGSFHLVAVYSRDLAPGEVSRHFQEGPNVRGTDLAPLATADPNAQLFQESIAPLLAKHCLECHDASTRKGKLDLSHKEAALAGGREGPPLEPGKPDGSLLWEVVASDEMPEDREPLSAEEKALLERWIEGGATWSLDFIDPATYAHEGPAGQGFVQRLTVDEYIETVRAAVGVDIAKEARELLPRDLRADGFSNTAYNLNVDLKHVNAWAQLAEIIVDRMDLEAFAKRFSDKRRFTDNDMGELIGRMGKWLLRGPLDEHEIISYRGISTAVASAGGDFEEAVGFLVEAMLQSPRFVYRVENQRGDGGLLPVNEYELASRLSYILWGGPPDDELVEAADKGHLLDMEGVEAQVARMLKDPRAVEKSTKFLSEWLHLDRLSNLQPSPERFPGWDRELAGDMERETLAFFKEVVWEQKRPLSDLLNAQVTFVTPRLAEHYGLAAEDLDDREGLIRLDLGSTPSRGGLLTQGSVLTIGGDEASMVTRGLFVLHNLLRGVVKDPPPGTDTTPVPAKPGQSLRDVAEIRISDRSCGGCHSRFEPLAFGLERFDGLGIYREVDEHGNALREDGEILFPGAPDPVTYQTAAELMDLLAKSERVAQSLTWKVTQFALGRPLTGADAPVLEEIHRKSQAEGGTYASLMKAIVMSDLVQMTPTQKVASR